MVDEPTMKTFILTGLILTTGALAKTGANSQNILLNEIVREAGTLNEKIGKVGRPQLECREMTSDLNRDTIVKDEHIKVKVCVPTEDSLTESTEEDYSKLIQDYNIEFHPDAASVTSTRHFRLFVHELKKFPPSLMQEMASAGGKIRLMIGDGVAQDPDWEKSRLRALEINNRYREWYNKQKNKNGLTLPQTDEEVNRGWTTTTEGGRQWDVVSGAGGVFMDSSNISPTRIVINRMYVSKHRETDGTLSERPQGATNLFLHEHGHALDNLYGHHTISSSRAWKHAMEDSLSQAFLPKIFSRYESDHEEEGFAEIFSYYHACEASRKQLEENAPALANFIKNLTSVKDLRPDHYQAWRARNKR